MPAVSQATRKLFTKDYNFFQRVAVSASSFTDTSDLFIPFSTNTVIFLNEGSGVVEFSFDGYTLHGETSSANANTIRLEFQNRVISAIWFRIKTGSSGPINVCVTAWGT